MTAAAVLALTGLLLLGLGCWGRRNVADLVARSLSPEGQVRQEGVLRRGALTCLAVGVAALAAAVAAGVRVW